MFIGNSFICISRRLCRKYSSKPIVALSKEVNEDIQNEVYKPRKHPGIVKPRTVVLPDEYINAIQHTCADYPLKKIAQDSVDLVNHLQSRVPPMEKDQLKKTHDKLLHQIIAKQRHVDITSEDEEIKFKQKIKDKLQYLLKQKVYNWKSINYNQYNSLVYLIGRCAQEYAVLSKIFSELSIRDKSFKPKSLFDFGSGVGTVSWAARALWKKHIFEYFNVDTSAEMNDLALILLQGGRGNKNSQLKGVFYRQFFPHQNVTYDLVVSAYSLLELPSFETRMETILRLWNKTEKYLVIVEYGSNAGFKVINEARDFILQIKDDQNEGHVFGPCPHDSTCPRFLANDHTPCNYEVSYFTLPFGGSSTVKKELYSYVVLKKGKRDPSDEQWPRLVRDVLVRSKHSVCRMCTANGKLEEVIFTAAKHGKTTYHCARSSTWGDRIPVQIQPVDK